VSGRIRQRQPAPNLKKNIERTEKKKNTGKREKSVPTFAVSATKRHSQEKNKTGNKEKEKEKEKEGQ
jgi:hypothetical protein